MSAEQYLREMEKILRKIRRREVRKRAFNKYYKGDEKQSLTPNKPQAAPQLKPKHPIRQLPDVITTTTSSHHQDITTPSSHHHSITTNSNQHHQDIAKTTPRSHHLNI